MTLTPDEIDALARAIFSYSGPVAVGTLVIGLSVGFLLNLRYIAPKIFGWVRDELTDPESPTGKAARAREEKIAARIKAEMPAVPSVDEIVGALTKDDSKFKAIVVDQINGAWSTAADEIEARVNSLEDAMKKRVDEFQDAVPAMIDDAIRRRGKGDELTDGRQRAAGARSDARTAEVGRLARLKQDDPAGFELYTKAAATIKAVGKLKQWTPREVREELQKLDDLVDQGTDLRDVMKEMGIKTEGYGGSSSSSTVPAFAR